MAFPKILITKKEADIICESKTNVSLSLDLGQTVEEVPIKNEEVTLRGQSLLKKAFTKIKEDKVYVFEDGELKSVEFFADDTNYYYKLKPTGSWPTIMISSTPMHRWKNITPRQDAMTRIVAIGPILGRVLDTCCGSGYTALTSARSGAEEVHVFERDKNVLRLAEYNPYSADLFTNKKIILKNESSFDAIKKFPDLYFDRIVHDPPTVGMSPELYSSEFYVELYRVMKHGAKLYHYTPAPRKTHGERFFPAVMKRLEQVGFSGVRFDEPSCGVVAKKK